MNVLNSVTIPTRFVITTKDDIYNATKMWLELGFSVMENSQMKIGDTVKVSFDFKILVVNVKKV